MGQIKTLKSFIKMIKQIESTPLISLKGYEKLSDGDRSILGELVAGMDKLYIDYLEGRGEE